MFVLDCTGFGDKFWKFSGSEVMSTGFMATKPSNPHFGRLNLKA